MAPVLNATEIENENELIDDEEREFVPRPSADDVRPEELTTLAESPGAVLTLVAPGRLQSVTLDPPADSETSIVLLVQKGSDLRYRSGFRIARAYETSPQEQEGEDLPPIDPETDEGFEFIGEAVAAAADMADEWLCFHSDEDDEKAKSAIDWLQSWSAWSGELDPASVTDAIFDPLPVEPAEAAAEPAVAAANPVYEDRCPVCDQGAVTGIGGTPGVTADAQKHFDDRKHQLEERLAKLSVEEMRLKAAVKCNREAMNSTTEEYQSHICRGPERLPLFDRTAKPQGDLLDGIEIANATAEESAEAESSTPAATEEKRGTINLIVGDIVTDDAWRAVSTDELGIDPKICILLREAQDKPIVTLGDISDFCEQYGLTDLKKIGKAKAQKIEEAMDAYWAANPRE